MPTIHQHINFKTKNGLIAKAQIEKNKDSEYTCTVYSDNANNNFSMVESRTFSSGKESFRWLYETIQKVISNQYHNDILDTIDNTCNCPHITKEEEQTICSSSITILVNGLDV
ncbi:hypothetical protein Abu_1327 [Aliarcobacter butzleri RM4018]|uniref:Uncharacterized protein n=1 Tax=Aliarcobacter butzleri (strain RM4018) TaxID=367737 RepID=A8EUF9_ALIB4|nr:hypothetical protein [Aliarcobacter butzleri]ABV67583.1 hypothetical protein Abu_1327 [Aliarcobacter butzleri RM4018]GGT74694.1 hypothetical protein GCM10007985_08250 [Aliarcobacter butzleri]SNV29407.1 Uncharacterised protein [Aliarcobacter butzleri]